MSSISDGAAGSRALLRDSLSDVVQASKVPAKRRGANIKPTVETLASECYDKGLLPDALSELVDLIIHPSHLDQASLNNLVRNLYPATSIDAHLIIKIVGCLGHGVLKPSLGIQAALLKWLIMTHHAIKDQDTLSKVYAVLFNLLDTAAIRPQLCHLLALATRRRHVRPYRIQAVLALSRQTGNDPALTGLLRVFKNYYPEIIVGDATRGKASTFKHPDPEWRAHLDDIQQAHAASLRHQNQPRDAFRVAHRLGNISGGKASVIPEVHTSHAHEDSVTLEEIDNAERLVNNLEKIELPNQLVSVLADPLLQKLMLLRPSDAYEERITNWLTSYTEDVVRGEATSTADLLSFLQVIQEYVSTTRHDPLAPAILSFFSSYLKVWDGKTGRQVILDILSYTSIPQKGFPSLYLEIFAPLERKVLDGSVESQLEMLKCYTGLLRQWTTIFLASEGNKTYGTVISDFVRHVNKLCLTLVQTSASASTHARILDFYELTAHMVSATRLRQRVRIDIPSSALVYLLHFSPSSVSVSRLCGVLSHYKEGFQAAMATSRTAYPAAYVNGFNGFLMDICNCLWRSKAFNNTDANAHGCLVPEKMRVALTNYVSSLKAGSSLSVMFTLSASPTLGLMATTYLRELEDIEMEQGSSGLDTRHAGPVTRTSLIALGKNGGVSLTWDEFRLGVLGYLEQQHLEGVGRLMHSTMTTLMNKR
ncbi:Mis6-domain-containing protein [Pestalotiopsis sp. NC0098]|nr:Mis6-domain-containing protein [Pestalotiopsis sp. NC0098]